MTTAVAGMPASVADALRRVWPKHTAKAAADATGHSPRSVEDWLQGRRRGDWDALIKLMARSDAMEREVLALVAAERGRDTDAGSSGVGAGMGAAERRAGGCGMARRAVVPGAGGAARAVVAPVRPLTPAAGGRR